MQRDVLDLSIDLAGVLVAAKWAKSTGDGDWPAIRYVIDKNPAETLRRCRGREMEGEMVYELRCAKDDLQNAINHCQMMDLTREKYTRTIKRIDSLLAKREDE